MVFGNTLFLLRVSSSLSSLPLPPYFDFSLLFFISTRFFFFFFIPLIDRSIRSIHLLGACSFSFSLLFFFFFFAFFSSSSTLLAKWQEASRKLAIMTTPMSVRPEGEHLSSALSLT